MKLDELLQSKNSNETCSHTHTHCLAPDHDCAVLKTNNHTQADIQEGNGVGWGGGGVGSFPLNITQLRVFGQDTYQSEGIPINNQSNLILVSLHVGGRFTIAQIHD